MPTDFIFKDFILKNKIIFVVQKINDSNSYHAKFIFSGTKGSW